MSSADRLSPLLSALMIGQTYSRVGHGRLSRACPCRHVIHYGNVLSSHDIIPPPRFRSPEGVLSRVVGSNKDFFFFTYVDLSNALPISLSTNVSITQNIFDIDIDTALMYSS